MDLEEGGEAPMQQEAEDASGEGADANLKRPRCDSNFDEGDAEALTQAGTGADRRELDRDAEMRNERLRATIVLKNKAIAAVSASRVLRAHSA
jgi:hypothetical protein